MRHVSYGIMGPIGGPPRLDVVLLASCRYHRDDVAGWLYQFYGWASYGDIRQLSQLQSLVDRDGRALLIPTVEEMVNIPPASVRPPEVAADRPWPPTRPQDMSGPSPAVRRPFPRQS